jgi:hypothetical protein
MNVIKAVVESHRLVNYTDKETGEKGSTYSHNTKCGKSFYNPEPIGGGTIIKLMEKKAGEKIGDSGRVVLKDGFILDGIIGNRAQYQEVNLAQAMVDEEQP